MAILLLISLLCPAPLGGGIKQWCCLTSVWRLSVAYIGPMSRTERPRKTKIIGTEIAHVTRDSDTTFKVKRSKVKVTGGGAYCGGLPPTACFVDSRSKATHDRSHVTPPTVAYCRCRCRCCVPWRITSVKKVMLSSLSVRLLS